MNLINKIKNLIKKETPEETDTYKEIPEIKLPESIESPKESSYNKNKRRFKKYEAGKKA